MQLDSPIPFEGISFLGVPFIAFGILQIAFFPAQRARKKSLEESELRALARFVPVTFLHFFLVRSLPLLVLGVCAVLFGSLYG